MDDVGPAATESGPEGFLPPEPHAMAAVLAAHGLTAVGGFPAIVEHLVASGYTGWYVLEQDTVLTDEPVGEGPAADVDTSAEHLRALLTGRALAP